MNVSVLIPTYRRPNDLRRCLDSLKKQLRSPDEVIVTLRDSDEETRAFLQNYQSEKLPLKTTPVSVTGVVAAMNAGLDAATGEIIVLTDDDAAPLPDWIERIEAHFLRDSTVAGVGGRDRIVGLEGACEDVGKLKWSGRVSANHHIGYGKAREVDVLKGVNCAYLAKPLREVRFDTRMRGKGAQVHWELSLGLTLRSKKWKLIYDPAILVDHFPAQRYDEDQRDFSPTALFDAIHNETLVMIERLSWSQRFFYLLWVVLVGARASPGLLQIPRLIIRRESSIFSKFFVTSSGRLAGIRSLLAK